MRKPKTKSKKSGGRPTGAEKLPTAETVETSCPRCGSTQRGRYTTKNKQAYQHTYDGKPYTHIIKRRTKCESCGLYRFDRTRENRTK